MTTDEIRKRITSLQDEINTLATLLPEHMQIAFGTLYLTEPTKSTHRKRLVVAINETAQALEKTQ
jgi:seryl-tRNA(Sec) selenium transferase